MPCFSVHARTFSRRIALGLTAVASLLGLGLLAQEASKDRYPKVTLATWYQLDPKWPDRPPSASFGEMPGIAVDSKDQVWVFTRASPPVQVYDQSGKLVRSWGDDLVKKAHHLKIDGEGNVWLADVGSHTVMKCTQDGKLLLTLGTKGQAGCDETHLDQPTDMAVSPAGDIFVSDGYGNSRVAHFDRAGRFVKAWGKRGVGPGEFSLPHAIVRDSRGRLYVADRNNVRVQVFEESGKFLSEWRDICVPWGFWITAKDEIWLTGSSPMPWRASDGALGCPPKDQLFLRMSPEGKVLQLWTVPKGEDGHEKPGDLNWVHCLALDSKGNIYAGDIKGHRAQRFLRREGQVEP